MSDNKVAPIGAFAISSPAPLVNPYRTPAPTTTQFPTPSPVKDPHEYEKSIYKGSITDETLEFLKDQIRILQGLQPILPPPLRKRVAKPCAVPKPPPRTNETSRIRAEMRKYRLIRRSGEFNKNGKSDEKMTPEKEQELANKGRQMNADEIDRENQQCELECLKQMASSATTSTQYKSNRASEYRFKSIRGEPIISSEYAANYDYHEKPPFVMVTSFKQLPIWKLPPIDREKEIWLIPQDEYTVPLHAIPKPQPSRTPSRRTARPSLKPYTTVKPDRNPTRSKRPTYRSHSSTSTTQKGASEKTSYSTTPGKSTASTSTTLASGKSTSTTLASGKSTSTTLTPGKSASTTLAAGKSTSTTLTPGKSTSTKTPGKSTSTTLAAGKSTTTLTPVKSTAISSSPGKSAGKSKKATKTTPEPNFE